MWKKIYAAVVIIIAFILAILASTVSQEQLTNIIYVSRFFDVMIPVLAVGALIKYIVKCGHCCRHEHKD